LENDTLKSLELIEKRIKNEFIIKSLERKEILQFPKEAFREAVVNAIMHRDYFDKTSDIMIEVYKNKLIIFNPGGLVSWLKPEEFGKISKTRNSLIASLLSRTSYSEKMGTGIKRIRTAMKKQGLQKPKFEFYEHSFYIELHDSKDTVKDIVKDTVKDTVKLNNNQKEILNSMKNNSKITVEELSIKIGINERNIKKNISKLKELGLIKRIGSDKSGYWEVK
jgi:ATP-dependent DNA helicase RecG